MLASGSADNTIRIWRIILGQVLDNLEVHTDWVLSVPYFPDNTKLCFRISRRYG